MALPCSLIVPVNPQGEIQHLRCGEENPPWEPPRCQPLPGAHSCALRALPRLQLLRVCSSPPLPEPVQPRQCLAGGEFPAPRAVPRGIPALPVGFGARRGHGPGSGQHPGHGADSEQSQNHPLAPRLPKFTRNNSWGRFLCFVLLHFPPRALPAAPGSGKRGRAGKWSPASAAAPLRNRVQNVITLSPAVPAAEGGSSPPESSELPV